MHLTHLSAVQMRCRELAVRLRCHDRNRTAWLAIEDRQP